VLMVGSAKSAYDAQHATWRVRSGSNGAAGTAGKEPIMRGICATVFVLIALAPLPALAQKQAVKINQQWSGSVADDALRKGTPEFITTAAGLEKLWKQWKLPGKVPSVDFDKELLLIVTTSGSKISLSAVLDNGNLEPRGLATRDFGPGFRYVIGSVGKEGVKTVGRKALPKE
jgi:hypothetical protein